MSSTATTSSPWLDRVDALLAKAASTEFPEEAEALLAKAQELMARHSIDEAVLEAAGRRRRGEITSEATTVSAPYASAKASLLGAVGHANDCRVVMFAEPGGDRRCTIVGHADDIEATRTLFSALSAHAVRTMLAAPVPFGEGARRFRHAFLLAFAGRIAERLRAARRSAEAEARRDGATGLDVVLADRRRDVDRRFADEFPLVRTARASSSSAAGHLHGRAAADTAALGSRNLPASRRGLPGR